MRRTTVLWEAFVTRFEDAWDRHKKGRLSAEEAGELLGISARHFRRLRVRYEEAGADGLRDRRLGRVSGRRAAESELARMRRLYREEYADFTVTHFHEELRRRHDYTLGYTVTRLALQSAGLVMKAHRRGQHRKKRPRRPLPGMLLFQDGSTHRWIGALGHELDLVVTLDDATGAIYSALLVAQEGTMSSFLGLRETIAAQGLFGALYTDRGSHYFLTPKAGLPDAQGGRQGGPAAADAGGPGAGPARHPPYPVLFPAGSGPDGTGVRHLAAAAAAGVAPGGREHARGRERLSARDLRAGVQRPLRQAGGRPRQRVCRLCRAAARRRAVRAGGSSGGPRQLRAVGQADAADPAAAAPPALRQGHRAGA